MGYMAIKHLKEKTVESILDDRKAGDFSSLQDFFLRVELDLADAMALTNAGCFSSLEPEKGHKEIAFQVACYHLQDTKGDRIEASLDREPLTREEKLRLEVESFGFPVSEHPLDKYLHYFAGRIKKARDIPQYTGQTINLAGVYITRKVTSTRKHEAMEFVTFEDETDIFECVMFPGAFEEFGDLLNWESLFILRGKVEEAFGVYTITIEKLSSLQRMVNRLNPQRHKDIQEMKLDTYSENTPAGFYNQ